MTLREIPEIGAMGPTELAAKLGVSKGYAHALLNGHKRPGLRVARQLEKLTGRPWHEFMTERAA